MLNQFETTIKRNALAYHAGQEMVCPGCRNILDARRAVELDFHKDGKVVGSRITCASCYDSRVRVNLTNIKLPEGVTVEVNDGRVLFARPKRTPKAKPATAAPKSKLDMERVMEAAQEDSGTGFCTACGEEQGGCEPDARRRKCDACGEMKVYGAEELLMMGA